MRYEESVKFLNSFINYERIGYRDRRTFKLGRMNKLAELFGNPEENFPSIHITGTKGKGSVASFIANILKEAGFTVGLYTSPHLMDLRERIRLNGELITRDDFAFYADEIKHKLKSAKLDFSPTYFEIITMLAFIYFRAKSIDYGVIEVGLGGRMDATNIVTPLVSAISPVSFDHMHILGETLEEIAAEKAGIIKKNCVCISAPQKKGVIGVIQKKCRSVNAELILVGRDIGFKEIYRDSEKEIFDIDGTLNTYKNCTIYLLGRHQIENAACAVGIAEALVKKGIRIPDESVKKGLAMTKNVGRCEIVQKCPYVVLDGAQNRASARALMETIRRNFGFRRLILVLGISKKKDIKGVCEELIPFSDIVILTRARVERAEEPRRIQIFAGNKSTILTDSVKTAMEKARCMANADDLILVTGSFFVIGEVKRLEYAEASIKV